MHQHREVRNADTSGIYDVLTSTRTAKRARSQGISESIWLVADLGCSVAPRLPYP